MTYNFLWFQCSVKIPALFNTKQYYSFKNTKQLCFSTNLNIVYEIYHPINIRVTAKRLIPYLFVQIVTFSYFKNFRICEVVISLIMMTRVYQNLCNHNNLSLQHQIFCHVITYEHVLLIISRSKQMRQQQQQEEFSRCGF